MDGIVLVMDYSKIEREKIKHILSQLGSFNIIEAASFNQYDQLQSSTENISLIIMDLEFPSVKEGFEILENLRSKPGNKDIPLIIVTRQDKPEYKEEALKYRVKDYIVKPYQVNRLESSLKSIVKVHKEFLYSTQGMESITLTFDEFIERELKFASRMNFPLSIVFITPYGLNKENISALLSPDKMTNAYSVIREKSAKILRVSDIFFLNNQKELLVILPGVGSKEATIACNRLKTAFTEEFEKMSIEYDELFFSVCVTFPEDGENFQGLMQSAFKRIADKEMLEKIASIPVNTRRYANRRYNQFNRWF